MKIECEHDFVDPRYVDVKCILCGERFSSVLIGEAERVKIKLSEARSDALRMAKIALVYIKREIGTIKVYESGHGLYAAGLDGVSVEETIEKYEEK